jgi:hypothetical protein
VTSHAPVAQQLHRPEAVEAVWLIGVMDLVDENEDFDPEKAYGFSVENLAVLRPEEQAALDGRGAAAAAARTRMSARCPRSRSGEPIGSWQVRAPAPGSDRDPPRLDDAATGAAAAWPGQY